MTLEERLTEFRKTLNVQCEDNPIGVMAGSLLFKKAMPADDYMEWKKKIPTELRDALAKWKDEITPPKDGKLKPENITLHQITK